MEGRDGLENGAAHRLSASETVLSSDACDAYGVQRQGNTTDIFGYGGQWGYYRDTETGLYLCMNRYYDPVSARWLTRDPIDVEGGINLYGYVGGNPVMFVDPEGLLSLDDLRKWGKQFQLLRHLFEALSGEKPVRPTTATKPVVPVTTKTPSNNPSSGPKEGGEFNIGGLKFKFPKFPKLPPTPPIGGLFDLFPFIMIMPLDKDGKPVCPPFYQQIYA